jgi:hypothetical protein
MQPCMHSHDIDVCQLYEVCADPHVRPEYVNMRQQVLAFMMGALRKTDLQLHLLQARKYSLGKPPLYESSSWRRQTCTPAPRCHGEPLREAASRRGPSYIQISARLFMIFVNNVESLPSPLTSRDGVNVGQKSSQQHLPRGAGPSQ